MWGFLLSSLLLLDGVAPGLEGDTLLAWEQARAQVLADYRIPPRISTTGPLFDCEAPDLAVNRRRTITVCGTLAPHTGGWGRGAVAVVRIDRPEHYRWLLCHELGHALGLDHRPLGDPSCMAPDYRVPHPDQIDLQRVTISPSSGDRQKRKHLSMRKGSGLRISAACVPASFPSSPARVAPSA
jgi:hypothetical protein